jgi:hypothetical protein
MKPAQTKVAIDRPTVLECLHYGYSTLPSSLDKWQDRSSTLSTYKALVDNVSGKIAEWGVYQIYVPRFSDLTKPDHKKYNVGNKSFKEDLETRMGNAKFAVKNKEFRNARRYDINATFSSNDPEIFGSNKNNDLYVMQAVTNTNLIDEQCGNDSLPIMQLDNVSVEIYYCVKLSWLHKYNLFGTPDHRHQAGEKKTVRYELEDTYQGVRTSSVWEIVEKEYDGDESILWQL